MTAAPQSLALTSQDALPHISKLSNLMERHFGRVKENAILKTETSTLLYFVADVPHAILNV
jgi:hypothetical protein